MPQSAARAKVEAGTSLEDSLWTGEALTPAELLKEDVGRFALFLDCDGTLLEIAARPEDVRVPPGLGSLLQRASCALGGALAILTGRRLAEIDVLLPSVRQRGAGVHGGEMRHSSGGEIAAMAAALPASLVEEVIRRTHALPGVITEPKGPGLAVHYRLAPHLKEALEAELRILLTRYADGLVLSPGRKLFEIIPAGHSKGTALEAFAAMPDFVGRIPVMIGDDAGDIPAFAAARRLGGHALRVAGEQFGHEDVEMYGPTEVLAWLQCLVEQLEARSEPRG